MSGGPGRNDKSIEIIPVTSRRRELTQETARELRREATPSEAVLWEHVRGRRLGGHRFRRQQPIGPYIVDFFCSTSRLIVEVDGPIHDLQQEYDLHRQADLEGAGYRVLRITAERVSHDLPAVLHEIEAVISSQKLPLSRAQGEGAGG